MRMQDETPEAWYVDLIEFDLADAMEAARTTTLTKTFIGVGDLVTECQNIARRRIGRQRQEEREREIAAENGGDADLVPVTTGEPKAPLALTAGPLQERLEDVQAGRREARDRFAARREAEAEQARVREERKAKRAEILAELHPEAGEAS
jgi:hypothetical protein